MVNKDELLEKLEGRDNVKIKEINNDYKDNPMNVILEVDGIEIYIGGRETSKTSNAGINVDYNQIPAEKTL